MFFKLILFFITIIMSFTSFSSSDITTSGAFPGYYLVSSIGTDGDISFFPLNPDEEQGFIELYEDFTGTFCLDGIEESITWDDSNFYFENRTLPYIFYPTEDEHYPMLVIYIEETETSVVFYYMEDE